MKVAQQAPALLEFLAAYRGAFDSTMDLDRKDAAPNRQNGFSPLFLRQTLLEVALETDVEAATSYARERGGEVGRRGSGSE